MASRASPVRSPKLYVALRSRLALLLTLASIAAAAALWISHGLFGPVALALMTAAWIGSVAAALLGRTGERESAPIEPGVRRFLALALAASCVVHVVFPPGMYLDPPHPTAFRALAAFAALGAVSYLVPLPRTVARWRFGVIGICFVAMAWTVLAASPNPTIDVWSIQQEGARAILGGENPYAATYANPYDSETLFGSAMVDSSGRLTVFPYPPLTFLLGAPALLLFHDVRVMFLCAMAFAAWALRRLGEGEIPELAALLILLQPTTFFVLEQSWTEPLVLAAFGGSLVAIRALGRRPRGAGAVGLAGGVLAAAKQYSPILVVPLAFALPRGARWRSIAIAAGVALATLVPFVLWGPGEFWHDVAAMQVQQPFRMDALSWLVPIAVALQSPPSAAWGFVGAGALLALLLRPGASLAQVVRVLAAAFLTFVLFNKQAFCNYYWLVVSLLLFATALELDPIARTPLEPEPTAARR